MSIQFFKPLPEVFALGLRPSPFGEATRRMQRPEGQRTGCALFSDRGRMPSRKMLVATTLRALFHLGEGVFFGSVSFAPFKRNELARSAKAFDFRQAQFDPRQPLPSPSGPQAQPACVRQAANQWFANGLPHPLPLQGREQNA